jgi:hypothetical protein
MSALARLSAYNSPGDQERPVSLLASFAPVVLTIPEALRNMPPGTIAHVTVAGGITRNYREVVDLTVNPPTTYVEEIPL